MPRVMVMCAASKLPPPARRIMPEGASGPTGASSPALTRSGVNTATASSGSNPSVMANGKLSYDPHKDLVPVAKVASAPLFLIVNADSPYKTVQDLVRLGSEKSEGLTMGSPGHGSLPHLSMELFLRDAGVKGVVVQYKGDVAAYTDLIAGRLDATLTAITAALPHIEAGKLRVLGVASEQPSAIYP